MSYCIDSNISVDIFRGDKKLSNRLSSLLGTGKRVVVTSVTLCELFKGAFLYHSSEGKALEILRFIDNFEVINMNIESCEEFGRMYKKMKVSGKMIPEFDLMIASIVKANNLTLITRDKKHFMGTGINLEIW